MSGWAQRLGLPELDQVRWRAAGLLHDVLREGDPRALRERVPPPLSELPGLLLHGPAAAERLRVEGVEDGELLHAIAFHTLGHVTLGRLGRALYAADFLEPGRDLLNDWRAELRARMPEDVDGVTRLVVSARIRHQIERGGPVRPETVAFWNSMAGEA